MANEWAGWIPALVPMGNLIMTPLFGGIYDKYGSLTEGKQADVVLLNKDLEIKYIIKAGEVVYGND